MDQFNAPVYNYRAELLFIRLNDIVKERRKLIHWSLSSEENVTIVLLAV